MTGYDKDPAKVQLLNAGESYIGDIASADLAPLVKKGHLRASTDPAVLERRRRVVVCVPTPLNKTKDPDMRFIVVGDRRDRRASAQGHAHRARVDDLSRHHPRGARPQAAREGYKIGKDVFVAFSPERVDPGNTRYTTQNTPKVIGGTTPACLEVAQALYARIIERWSRCRAPTARKW